MSLITDDQFLELLWICFDMFWYILIIITTLWIPVFCLGRIWKTTGLLGLARRDALVVHFPCTRSTTISTLPWRFVCKCGVPTNGRARVGNFTKPYDLGLSLTGEYLQTRIASDYGRPQLQAPPLILNEILIWKLQPLKSVWILNSLVVFGIWT